MTLPLPGESETGFKLIRPFTPINRPNMTAWMAAQSDPQGNARLVVYRFPRQVTVFGPQQVEARINQDPEISSAVHAPRPVRFARDQRKSPGPSGRRNGDVRPAGLPSGDGHGGRADRADLRHRGHRRGGRNAADTRGSAGGRRWR